MKLVYSLGISLLLSVHIFGQNNEKMTTLDKAIIEQFKNGYKKKNYKKFEGTITVTGNQVQFGNKFLYYDKSDKITNSLLKEGLIYPQLLTDYQMQKFLEESTDKTQKRYLKLQKDPSAGFDMNNVKISNATELAFFGSEPKTKRFKVSCKDSKLNTSFLYLLELTNKNATKETSLEEFIKGAKLIYLQQML